MKEAREIPAIEVMEEDPARVELGDSLGSAKNRMEEENLRAIPVVDSEDNLEGALSYRELVRHIQFGSDTRLDKVMHQPPEFESDSSLMEICELRINSGRKMLVNQKGEKLAGVIRDREFKEVLGNVRELKGIESSEIVSKDLETVREKDSLEKARHKILDRNISRLPVLDENNNLTGILRSTDLLAMMVPAESQDAGGTSGGRNGNREINIAGGSEKKKMSEIPVKELFDREVYSMEDHIDMSGAAEKFVEEDLDEIVFTDGRVPKSILTIKDFVDLIAEFAPGQTVLVNLIGLDMPEEKAAVHEKIKTQLRGSIGRKLKKPEELTVRFKKAEKDGTKHRWEVEMKLYSEYGMINVEEDGWEMLDVIDSALEQLDSMVRKKKEKRSEH